jgi:type IV secretory pathway TrbL component
VGNALILSYCFINSVVNSAMQCKAINANVNFNRKHELYLNPLILLCNSFSTNSLYHTPIYIWLYIWGHHGSTTHIKSYFKYSACWLNTFFFCGSKALFLESQMLTKFSSKVLCRVFMLKMFHSFFFFFLRNWVLHFFEESYPRLSS